VIFAGPGFAPGLGTATFATLFAGVGDEAVFGLGFGVGEDGGLGVAGFGCGVAAGFGAGVAVGRGVGVGVGVGVAFGSNASSFVGFGGAGSAGS
jgi:hypothetical protein